jgi:hypothetical protein
MTESPQSSDEEFLRRFESLEIAGDSFHHADHVRLAFVYLGKFALLEALIRFTSAIKAFAAANGKPERYHETITWAYMFLINQRRAQSAAQSWEEFAAAHGDLLIYRNGILDRYYKPETLSSPAARSGFVLPDKL